MIKNIIELYIDIVQMFVKTSNNKSSHVYKTIMGSNLGAQLENGLGCLDPEEAIDITGRYRGVMQELA
jgi:hypothetical protein